MRGLSLPQPGISAWYRTQRQAIEGWLPDAFDLSLSRHLDGLLEAEEFFDCPAGNDKEGTL